MLTFNKEEKPDFNVDMADAVLNLETRVIDSKRRTNVKRADFEIAGDTMQFNTVTHQGTLTGNVKMTIYNQKEIAGGAAAKP
jgi:lipopolysaccharide export system protein LptC